MRIFLLSTVMIFILISCVDRNYVVTKEYISCNKKIGSSFDFWKIEVDSLNPNMEPERFQPVRRAFVGPKNENDLLPKKVFFYRKSSTYDWYDVDSSRTVDGLPFELRKGTWCLISSLTGAFGNPDRRIFVYVDEEGNIEIKHVKPITNW